MRKAFITGITGQDGSYLAEFLLGLGYEVHGLIRRASTFNTERIDHLYHDPHDGGRLHLHYGDVTDGGSLTRVVLDILPDEVYNLAAQSHVRVSFDQPEYSVQAVAVGALNVLEAVRAMPQPARLYQASSSEMFGRVLETPQKETTPFRPRSPYGCAKVYAFHQTVNYREAYDLHASNGILFNHESPRRGETFVTRKITRAAARIKVGLQHELYLGNLDARRDWGFAGDYVEAMWRMVQRDDPDDYVIATGETHSVREFAEEAFRLVGLDAADFVRRDTRYERPAEVDLLLGDASKAGRVLDWRPWVGFRELVRMMVESDLELAKREAWLRDRLHRGAAVGALGEPRLLRDDHDGVAVLAAASAAGGHERRAGPDQGDDPADDRPAECQVDQDDDSAVRMGPEQCDKRRQDVEGEQSQCHGHHLVRDQI